VFMGRLNRTESEASHRPNAGTKDWAVTRYVLINVTVPSKYSPMRMGGGWGAEHETK